MDPSPVEGIWSHLVKSRLLSAEDVRRARRHWRQEAGERQADADAFGRWLVDRQYLTAYQAELVLRGKVDRFFLNEYKLLDRLGVGRMAGVFKAVHRLGQTVAIKVLPRSKATDPETFARFRREARLALKLRHPNVVRTFQLGEDGGLHYLVMEYLDGETLEEVLKRRGRLAPAEAASVVYQALLGLGHLHEQGVVHRDLKPANLMLVPGGDTPNAVVKILDVGLGRALFDEGEPGESIPGSLTEPGTILGDPDYLAPEQARDAHAADVRSDIYSLGCVLYHALAGQPPFPESNRIRKMLLHATEPPRPLKEFDPAAPDGMQEIVNWMLAKDPAARCPTPELAAQALAAFVSGQAPARAPAAASSYLHWLDAQPPVGEEAPAAVSPAALPPVPAATPVSLSLPFPPAAKATPVPSRADGPAAAPLSRRRSLKNLLDFGTRDFFFLVLGISGALLALALGFGLVKWFRHSPPKDGKKTE